MTAPHRIRVLVADDQAIVRDGLVTLLGLLDDLEIVGEAADGEQAVRLALETRPDVVLMDLRMPVLDGAAATARILEQLPETAVVVLTTFADDASIAGALRAGARGYLTKDAGRAELAAAVRAAASGQATFAREVGERLVRGFAGPAFDPWMPRSRHPPGAARALPGPDRARGRGAGAHRGGSQQRRDRRIPLSRRLDGEEPHQRALRQARRARPRAGDRVGVGEGGNIVTVKMSPLMGAVLAIVAACGIAITVLAVIDGSLTGNWLDANAAVGYPADGFILLALAGLGVLVFLAAVVVFLVVLASGSRAVDARP